MSLNFLKSIELPANEKAGGFDHAAIHAPTGRLYVAHTSNDAVDVIDCRTDRYLHSIPNLRGVAGAVVSDERNLVFTSNRGEDTIGFFPANDDRRVEKIAVGVRPNGLAFDPERQLLLAANVGSPEVPGSHSLSLVDLRARKLIAAIPVPGKTRWTIHDRMRDSFYVNIGTPSRILVIRGDRPAEIAATFEVPEQGPHGLDMESRSGRLFCACDSGVLVTLAAEDGAVLAKTPLSGAPDVIFFNPSLNHLYVAVGDPGVIDVIDTKEMRRIQTLKTGPGAHTIAFDASSNRVFAFLPRTHEAAVYVDE